MWMTDVLSNSLKFSATRACDDKTSDLWRRGVLYAAMNGATIRYSTTHPEQTFVV